MTCETAMTITAICCLLALIGIVVKSVKVMLSYLIHSCHHEDVWEMRNCDVMCRDCSKNLGFIETWRAQQLKKGKACRSTPL